MLSARAFSLRKQVIHFVLVATSILIFNSELLNCISNNLKTSATQLKSDLIF